MIARLVKKKRLTEKVLLDVFLNAQPYPKVRNAAQDYCDG